MKRLYLDNCCFNRPYDDQKQLRIQLETEAKLYIQQELLARKFELAWSYIREPFDYTKWHENLDDNISVRELSKKAMEYQQK
jgi:hypothetical protein